MYLTSEESRNSLSDESIYSVSTTDLIFKSEGKSSSSSINNFSLKPKRKREKLDHLSNEEKVNFICFFLFNLNLFNF